MRRSTGRRRSACWRSFVRCPRNTARISAALSVAYIAFGVILPRKCSPTESVDVELLALKTREPTKGERIELDAQYRLWLGLSILAAVIGLGIFAVGFIVSGK